MVENPPANAGDTGSSSGLGRSHMLRSNWALEPQLLSLHIRSLCSTTREAAIVRGPCTVMKSGPCSPRLEEALAQKRRTNRAKKKKKRVKVSRTGWKERRVVNWVCFSQRQMRDLLWPGCCQDSDVIQRSKARGVFFHRMKVPLMCLHIALSLSSKQVLSMD